MAVVLKSVTGRTGVQPLRGTDVFVAIRVLNRHKTRTGVVDLTIREG